jgi:hypothetical protein
MPELLATLEGDVIDVDRAEADFAAAMAAPAADRAGMPAPARKPPEPDPDPDRAPHGWTYDEGEWRPKKHPGRPRTADKSDRPRVADAPRSSTSSSSTSSSSTRPPASAPAKAPANYTRAIKDTAEGLWFMLATVPVPDQAFGYQLAGLRTRARVQAHLVEQNVDRLAAGVNLIGQHNKFVGRALERLAAGEGGLWILPACMALAPFVAATGQLWTGTLGDESDLQHIAAKVEADAQTYIQQMAGQAAAADPA